MEKYFIMPIFITNMKKCFVKCKFDNKKLNIIPIKDKEIIETWDRYPEKKAKKQGYKIIKCSLCQENAVVIDNFYPFNARNNLCKYHLEKKLKLLKKDKVAC
jgi:hypothetical protein